MAGSYILCNKLHHNGLMADLHLMSICPIPVPIANYSFLTHCEGKTLFFEIIDCKSTHY